MAQLTESVSHYYSETRLLRVSLSDQRTKSEVIDPTLTQRFLGGRGLGVKLLYDCLPPKTHSLSPENMLVFAVGPVTATTAPTSGRLAVVTKSPLTGTIFDSNVGGHVGAQLRRAGYCAVVITGAADTPVYLWIDNDNVEIRDATPLWGLDTALTTDRVLQQTDSQAQVLCIGPGGENTVSLAAIITDKHRAAGRGGVGAVMGSKKLKAVVVRGSGRPEVTDSRKFDSAVKRARLLLKKNPITDKSLPVYGTSVLVNVINELGMLPTHNFREGTFNDAEGISGEKLLERFFVKPYHCYGCPIGCGRIIRVDGPEEAGPEYESIWSLGPQCGISDLKWITIANRRCNLLGVDTISVGSTIGCAMELVERGLLNASLRFGSTDGLLELIDDMAHNRGLGAQLARGSRLLAAGLGAPETAMHVKGLEIPAYDPRGVQGHALGYATSNRGGCHLRSYMIGPEVLGSPVLVDRDRTEGKPEMVILYQNLSAAMDSMIVCRFSSFAWTVDDYAELVSSALGIPLSGNELLAVGERIWNLERLFNLREGLSSADDRLPFRFDTALRQGNSRNRVARVSEMLPHYYSLRGWDEQGVPTPEKLSQIGLAA
ncbi:MAG: aldehyde ferredoxin oxidoreductase family protein [Candidatus Thorarchaeota archaeon]|nr:aldehyde ferredoxin oxidoreductase family protein [Candidatus Thorarchaeota archaeon]